MKKQEENTERNNLPRSHRLFREPQFQARSLFGGLLLLLAYIRWWILHFGLGRRCSFLLWCRLFFFACSWRGLYDYLFLLLDFAAVSNWYKWSDLCIFKVASSYL